MSTMKYFNRLKANKYFTSFDLYAHYATEKDLIIFILDVQNILERMLQTKNIGLRYRDQKELLKVLKFILAHYKLYLINSPALKGTNNYENIYHPRLVGMREALTSILIYELSKSLGYPEEIYKYISIEFFRSYKKDFHKNNVYNDSWNEHFVWSCIGGEVHLSYSYEYLRGNI